MNDITTKLVGDYDYYLGYAINLTGNKETARVFVQDAFVKVAGTHKEDVNYARTWFCTIIHNFYLNFIRKQTRHRSLELLIDVADARRPADLCYVELRETLENLEKQNSLPNIQLFCDYALRDKTYREIAAKWGIRMGTVKSRMYSARIVLRKTLHKFL